MCNVYGQASFDYYTRVKETEYGLSTLEIDELDNFDSLYEEYENEIKDYTKLGLLLDYSRRYKSNKPYYAKGFSQQIKSMCKQLFNVDQMRFIGFKLHLDKASEIVEMWPQWKQDILKGSE